MSFPFAGGRNARSRARSDQRHEAQQQGQATVELALTLPLVLTMLMLLFQVVLVGRDEILVVHAARDAAREASVTHDPDHIGAAATRNLPGSTVRIVRRGKVGDPVEVSITYVSHTRLPLIGALVPDITLHGHSVMRVETP